MINQPGRLARATRSVSDPAGSYAVRAIHDQRLGCCGLDQILKEVPMALEATLQVRASSSSMVIPSWSRK